MLSFLQMLKNNSNQEHLNSSDTDPLHYWQQIIELLSFFFSFYCLLIFVTLVFASAVEFCCIDYLEDDDTGLDIELSKRMC